MLIPTTIFDGFKIAAIGGFFLALAAGGFLVPKNVDRDSPRGAKLRKRIFGVLAVWLVLAIAGFGLEPFGAPVLIVKITDNGVPRKTHARRFGTTSYSFQDGHAEALAKADGTVVVNDSKRPMHVETQSYGDTTMATMTTLTTKREEVPALKVTMLDHAIDYVGPDDSPPPEVEGHYFENKYWLVW